MPEESQLADINIFNKLSALKMPYVLVTDSNMKILKLTPSIEQYLALRSRVDCRLQQ